MSLRAQPTIRPRLPLAWLVAALSSACNDPLRYSYVLTDEAVVVAQSVSVIEDGPYADELVSLPAGRPRAEVLPLDTVELDALIVDVDGPRALDDAVWVLCGGDGCLAAIEAQGERYGVLEPCTVDAAASAFACLAGRGERPRVVMPAIVPNREWPLFAGAYAFLRVAVIVGRPDGLTTDECLEQLLLGPRTDLWGCAIGVRELPYGPPWALQELADELLDTPGIEPVVLRQLLGELGVIEGVPRLPPQVTRLLTPNAAPRIDAVGVGSQEELFELEDLEIHSVDEVIELQPGARVAIDPVISVLDRQIVLQPVGLDAWVGAFEQVHVQAWSDEPLGRMFGTFPSPTSGTHIYLVAPQEAGPVHLYVSVTDTRQGVSWFTLALQVVAR